MESAKTNNNPVKLGLFRKWWLTALNTPLCGFVLADGGTSGKVKLTLPGYDSAGAGESLDNIGYRIKGKIYTLDGDDNSDAKDDFWDLTGLTDLTAGQYCKVLLTVDTSGTAQVHKGDNASSQAAAKLPLPPDNECPFGWVETAGSNDWDNESITTSGTLTEGYDVLR